MAEATLQSLQTGLGELNKLCLSTLNQLTAISTYLSLFEERMEARFEKIDQRLDQHEELLHFLIRVVMRHDEDITDIKHSLRRLLPQTT